MDTATEFYERLKLADQQFATAIFKLYRPLKVRHDSGKSPRRELLQEARRIWISDMPSLGSIAGPTLILGLRRLSISERRAVACSYELPEWWRLDGTPAIGLVDICLLVKSRKLLLTTQLLELFKVSDLGEGPDIVTTLIDASTKYPYPPAVG